MEQLRTVVERCLEGQPVQDRAGKATGEVKLDISGANKALELIGKYLQAAEESPGVTETEARFLRRIKEMSDEELDEQIERLGAEIQTDAPAA